MGGGGGTTYQTTTLPSAVENTLASSAGRIGGMHSQNDIAGYNNANPQGTAGWNIWEQAATNQIGMGAETPWAEQYLMSLMGSAPSYAGQTPQSFYAATGSQPAASAAAMQQVPFMEYWASQVSPRFYQGPTTQEGEALNAARMAQAWGQQAPLAYAAVQRQAQQVPLAYDMLQGQAQQVPLAYATLQGQAQQVPLHFGAMTDWASTEGQRLAPTGASLTMSPSLEAARFAFNRNILPTIENQAAVSGLGRSTALTNATAQAEAQYMLPVIQDELSREFQANLARYQMVGDVGMQQAMAQERGGTRGLEAGLQYAQAQERGLTRGVEAGLQQAQAQERGLTRGMDVGLQQANAMQQLPQTFLASAQMLSQLGQQETARQLSAAEAEERGTIRRTQAIESAISTLQNQGQMDLARQLELATAEERAISRGTEATVAGYAPLLQQGGAETARLQEYYNRILGFGAQQREMEQAQLDAQYNDYLRRQALAETAVYAPFNQAIPSAFGSIARQSGGGGLFK